MSESNVERLVRLKKQITTVSGLYSLKYKELHWLIEQARYANDAEPVIKKVAKLNEYISRNDVGGVGRLGESVIDISIDELKRYREENERLRDALEGLGKAVEIYSGMPVNEALKEAIELVEEDSK